MTGQTKSNWLRAYEQEHTPGGVHAVRYTIRDRSERNEPWAWSLETGSPLAWTDEHGTIATDVFHNTHIPTEEGYEAAEIIRRERNAFTGGDAVLWAFHDDGEALAAYEIEVVRRAVEDSDPDWSLGREELSLPESDILWRGKYELAYRTPWHNKSRRENHENHENS